MPKNVVATQNHSNPAVPIERLQMIALASITPHPNNPRKHFDPDSLKEVAVYVPRHIMRFCAARRFVPEDGKLRIEPVDAFFEGHITRDGGTCPSDAAMKAVEAVGHG